MLQKIRTGLKPLEEKILRHRHLEAFQTSRVAREKLRIFADEQYHIIASDLRSIAQLLCRHGNLASRLYILAVLEGENGAFEALAKFAHALEMSDEELSASEPIPAALAYSAFVAWLALYGSDAELAAAFAVNLPASGANCGRISAPLKAQYRLGPEAVSFFDLFADLPPSDDTALAVDRLRRWFATLGATTSWLAGWSRAAERWLVFPARPPY